MKNIKYIAVDFDGTILDEHGQLPKNLENKFIELQAKGFVIVLASGRSLNGIIDVARKIKLDEFGGYISAYNGAEVYEVENGKLKQLSYVGFTKKQVEEIVEIIGDDFLSITTYHKDIMSVSNMIPQVERSSKIMGMKIDNDFIKDTPKILLIDTKEGVEEKKDDVIKKISSYDETINVFSSVPHLIEITPMDAQKGKSLELIAKINKTDSSSFICFGDEENDLSMFKYAKTSVAMGNAIDIIKKEATYITLSNKEYGVLKFLEENF